MPPGGEVTITQKTKLNASQQDEKYYNWLSSTAGCLFCRLCPLDSPQSFLSAAAGNITDDRNCNFVDHESKTKRLRMLNGTSVLKRQHQVINLWEFEKTFQTWVHLIRCYQIYVSVQLWRTPAWNKRSTVTCYFHTHLNIFSCSTVIFHFFHQVSLTFPLTWQQSRAASLKHLFKLRSLCSDGWPSLCSH